MSASIIEVRNIRKNLNIRPSHRIDPWEVMSQRAKETQRKNHEFFSQFPFKPEKLRYDVELDVVVIGAGIVGLAVAREFALHGREVAVIESEPAVGLHTSGRNSEVNHAGMNYNPGSLKASMCVRGHDLLASYCIERGIPYKQLGKLIVATNDSEIDILRKLHERGQANGVHDLKWLTSGEVRQIEPAVQCTAALHSPSTGIFDSHSLLQALRRDVESHGGHVFLSTQVHAGHTQEDGMILAISQGTDRIFAHATTTINCAGLNAPLISMSIYGKKEAAELDSHRAAGHYFTLKGPSPFSHLIYPVPVPGGLGIHLTLDMAGNARFGPDVEYLYGDEERYTGTIDYNFRGDVKLRMSNFYAAIRRYWPGLPDGALAPGFVGIRPKAGPEGSSADDFIINGPQDHGAPGLVEAFAIESPGATSCLALAEYIFKRAQETAIPLTEADALPLVNPYGVLEASFNKSPVIDFFA